MNGKRRKTKDEKSYVKQQGIIGEVEKSFTDDVILWEKIGKAVGTKGIDWCGKVRGKCE